MKTFTHTGLGTSAIAICFVALITRRDGVTFPITAAAQNLTIVGDANTYLAVNADFGDLPYSAAIARRSDRDRRAARRDKRAV
jgi:hypothetical protein